MSPLNRQPQFISGGLLVCSIVNIIFCVLSVSLEVASLFVGQGIWSGVFYIVTGLLGYSAFYKPSCKQLIIATTTFSSLSICVAIATSMVSILGSFQCGRDVDYLQLIECPVNVTQVTLAALSLLAFVNNIIVTYLARKMWRTLVKPSTSSQTAASLSTVQPQCLQCQPCSNHHQLHQNQNRQSISFAYHDTIDPPPPYSTLTL